MFLQRKLHGIKKTVYLVHNCGPCLLTWTLVLNWMFFNGDPYYMTHMFTSSKTPLYAVAYVL